MFHWYYVGQYGQLGPLSEDQMLELVESQVIVRDTYVWKDGMTDWVRAASIPAFSRGFGPIGPPPPPAAVIHQGQPYGRRFETAVASNTALTHTIVSPSSRMLAGVLQLLIPGMGRMYLGYLAIGLLQFMLGLCTLYVFHLWSFVDGILILTGHVNHDGYGRTLKD